MEGALASVIIPVEKDCGTLQDCVAAVRQQNYERLELVVVCNPGVTESRTLEPGSEDCRVMRLDQAQPLPQLVNEGMRAGRGHVKVLLMPQCVPLGDNWLDGMVSPFEDEEVGAVVAQCAPAETSDLARCLAESVMPRCRQGEAGELQETVSHLCDAYRASLLADIGYFSSAYPDPGQAIDMSIKVAAAGYSILLAGDAAVEWRVDERGFGAALREGYRYGVVDARLGRDYELRWLNAGIYAAALVALLLPLVSIISLPLAWLGAFGVFVYGWLLTFRMPLLDWETPLAPLNLIVYGAAVVSIRDDWAVGLVGRSIHPAILRQWCWVGAVVVSYVLVLLWTSFLGVLRSRKGGVGRAFALWAGGIAWRLAAGVGYAASGLGGGAGKQ